MVREREDVVENAQDVQARAVVCGVCRFCKDNVSNGGPGKLKKGCIRRQWWATLDPGPNSSSSKLTESSKSLQQHALTLRGSGDRVVPGLSA